MSCINDFERDEFRHLEDSDKKRLLKLIAQVSETAYRRGAQQGAMFALNGVIEDAGAMADWRYDIPLDRRPFVDQMASWSWRDNEEMSVCGELFGVLVEPDYRMKSEAKKLYGHLAQVRAKECL